LEIEGECKIASFDFLAFNTIKTAFILPLMILSIFGLLVLKHSKRLRIKLFYDQVRKDKASHIHVIGSTKNEEEIILL